MKKNISYYQQAIVNELLKEYTTRDLANHMPIVGDDLVVYGSDSESITLRKDKDVNITDNAIVKSLAKVIKKLVEESDDIEDILSDIYDFKYNEKYITEGYIANSIRISRSGKLIRVDIDLH